jgi:hypothetical protein
MLVRGFDGAIPTLERLRWRAADSLLLASITLACVAARVLPLADWLGRRLLG